MSTSKTKHRRISNAKKGDRSRSKTEGRRESGLYCTETGSVVTLDECGCVERRRVWTCEEVE
jgi:hypothetical protein